MKHFFWTLTLILSFIITASGWAGSGKIVAVVNDTPISSFDVEARLKLITAQQPDQSNTNAAFEKEVLNVLIDEEIKKQAARKDGLSLSAEDVSNAVAHLEKQNNLPAGGLKKMLAEKKIPLEALEKQIEADLLWLQYLQKNKKAGQPVSEQSVNKKQADIRREMKKESFLVAEILTDTEEKALEALAELHAGASFEKVAARYSVAPSREKEGFVGWIEKDHYGPKIAPVLSKMEKGQISRPLSYKKDFLLIGLLDKKMPIESDTISIWEMAQMAVDPSHTLEATNILAQASSCDDFAEKGKKFALPGSAQRGLLTPLQMPHDLFELLKDKPLMRLIGPINAGTADMFFLKCAEQEKRVVPTKEEIKAQLEMEQMGVLSDQLLTSLKRYAVIRYQ